MQRREFMELAMAAGCLAGGDLAGPMATIPDDVVRETFKPDQPHTGKVLATIAPHSDDHSIFAGGLIAKLIREGYTGYLIRTSNDEKDSYDLSLGETVLANERDNQAMAEALGIRQVFDLGYRNHRMDDDSRVEIRARLIFLFRLLKVDTVITFDPYAHYEENPDHTVTAQAVEAACWMAAGHLDFPEHFAAGLKPHAVRERYYYARGPQWVNRVVDISTTIDAKVAAIAANRTMIGTMVRNLRDDLARRGLKLPALEQPEPQAIANFIDLRFRQAAATVGQAIGVDYAEKYHYVGPDPRLEAYARDHAVPLEDK